MSKSEEESVEHVGEPVSRVLKEIDPKKSLFLPNPTLALIGWRPSGQPSSYNHISQEKKNYISHNNNHTNKETDHIHFIQHY